MPSGLGSDFRHPIDNQGQGGGGIAQQIQRVAGLLSFVAAFATHGGGVAPSGQQMVAVNLRCVPDIDLDALKIDKVDGAKF